MIGRRQFLLCGAALAIPLSLQAASPLDRLLSDFAAADLEASPEEAAELGLDKGDLKTRLNDRSLAGRERARNRIADHLRRLRAFDAATLSEMERIDYDTVRYILENFARASGRYVYGGVDSGAPYFASAGAPYMLSQLNGAYCSIPDFLDGQHSIAEKTDADAYLARLSAFAAAMDQEIEATRHDAQAGCVPPDFTLSRTLGEMARLRSAAPGDSSLVTSLVKRTSGDYADKAEKLVREQVYPALDRQIAFVKDMAAKANSDAGVWKFPDGDAYYADSLACWTSSPLDPTEIHRLGRAKVAEYSAAIDTILTRQGMQSGGTGERLRVLFNDPQFRYPNTDEGKAKLVADLDAKLRTIRAKAPDYFGVMPKTEVVAKRVPSYLEAARPRGYYLPPSVDGSRPGTYYINLRDTAETPRWMLPNQAFHQSIPGHHMKLGLYQQAKVPLLRKTISYAAYLEGWSLYAEQLADEMGMYEDDPFGRVGYLYGALQSAVRLVIDTGLHAQRWSREQAIAYYVESLGDPPAAAATEVERYCIWPGQACTYLLDKLAILDLRDKAKAALGAHFDIRRFHDAILLCGSIPQKVLTTAVESYIRAS